MEEARARVFLILGVSVNELDCWLQRKVKQTVTDTTVVGGAWDFEVLDQAVSYLPVLKL